MTELYPSGETQRLKKRARCLTWLAWLLAAAALLCCIVCCARVTTLHALRLQWTAVIVSTAAGWSIMLLYSLAIAPPNPLWLHAEGLQKGAVEVYTGVLMVSGESFRIPHSVTVRKVLLEGDESVSLNVVADKARQLPKNGTRIRITAVRRYITAWEVCYENA